MKKLENFTLKEYDEYKKLLNEDDFDIFKLTKLFGIENAEDMDMPEFNEMTSNILSDNIIPKQIKTEYIIGQRYFKPVLMINEIKAAQFIDFQTYMAKYEMKNILSVFLLPIDIKIKKNVFRRNIIKKKVHKYGDGYDRTEVQDFIYNNMTICEAISLSNFFLNLSIRLLPVIQNSLMKKVMKEMVKLKRTKVKSH